MSELEHAVDSGHGWITNPLSGEAIRILETAAETRGERLTFELRLKPGGRVPSGHLHPHQMETFTVLEGRMRFRRGLRVVHAGPGTVVEVAPGTFHTFLNEGPGTARAVVQSRPALRMEEVLVRGAELGRTRAAGGSRARWILEALSFLGEYRNEVAAPAVPVWVIAALAAAARALAAARGWATLRPRSGASARQQ